MSEEIGIGWTVAEKDAVLTELKELRREMEELKNIIGVELK
jgi:hypothetical protein